MRVAELAVGLVTAATVSEDTALEFMLDIDRQGQLQAVSLMLAGMVVGIGVALEDQLDFPEMLRDFGLTAAKLPEMPVL